MTADARASQVDQLLTRWAKADSPGCSLAVMQNGEILYAQGYGMANLEYHIPNTPETIFHVASVSKQFATAAIMLLAGDGQLSITDDIRQYIPEMHDFGQKIELQHLIHHTSGLRDQWELLVTAGWRMDDVITLEDILELLYAQRELNFKPGAEYTYCNSGYTLLGEIVKRVTGKSLRQFCDERIFQPLGMSSTHFHDNYRELVPNRAYSYADLPDGGFQHAHLMYSNVGATSLFTTVLDLLRWGNNYLEPTVGGADWTARMTTRGILNDGQPIPYAGGVMLRDYRGQRLIEHSGGDAGYRTHLMVVPDQQFVVAVFANLGSIMTGRLAAQVADIYLADHLTGTPVQPISLPPEEFQARAGVYYNADTSESTTLEFNADKGVLTFWGLALEALAQDRYRLVAAPQIELRFDAAGVLVESGSGRPTYFSRVTPPALSPEQLAAYVGVYYSPELDVRYNIVVEGEGLALKRRKYGQIALKPITDDAFQEANFGFDVLFSRDGAGQVSGLQVTTNRVRRLAFRREG